MATISDDNKSIGSDLLADAFHHSNTKIVVNTKSQTLTLYYAGGITKYPISTAKNGTGNRINSECTPLGKHFIVQKIGDGLPINSVFVARQFTGEIYDDSLAKQYPNRDWILTRILRLQGLECGVNAGVDSDGVCCDSFERFIYIHGTPDSEMMGVPLSHGCIRMKNADIIHVFACVPVNCPVLIV